MVTILAIQRGFRVPDAIFPHYPAVVHDPYYFTPSYLLSINDDILSLNATRYILKSLMQSGEKPNINGLLSPLVIDDKILAKFPKVRNMVCELDILRDQSFLMMMRLKKQGVDCKMYFMKDYLHGANQMDTRGFGISEFHNGILL